MNKSLNTFRAIAFLAVFLFHSEPGYFGFGYLGVLAFFVLSGYLITPILLTTRDNTSSFKDYLLNFYGRRALRIFPPYYLYLFITALAIVLFRLQYLSPYNAFMDGLPYGLTYTYNFYYTTKWATFSPLLSHFWSLAVEEQFYIFWPLIIFYFKRRHLKSLLLGLIIAGPVIRFLTALIVNPHVFSFFNGHLDSEIYVLPFSHIDSFLMGGYASLYLKERHPSNLELLLTLVGIIAIGLFTSRLFTHHLQYFTLGYLPYMRDSYKYIWGYSFFALFFTMILIRLNRRDFLRPLFENGVMDYLGRISYGLYIFHYPMIHIVDVLFNFKYHLFSTVTSLLLTTAISMISFEWYERRVLKLKDKFFPTKSPAKQPDYQDLSYSQ